MKLAKFQPQAEPPQQRPLYIRYAQRDGPEGTVRIVEAQYLPGREMEAAHAVARVVNASRPAGMSGGAR